MKFIKEKWRKFKNMRIGFDDLIIYLFYAFLIAGVGITFFFGMLVGRFVWK